MAARATFPGYRLRIAIFLAALLTALAIALSVDTSESQAWCDIDGCGENYCWYISADRWCRGIDGHHYYANYVNSGPFRKCAVLEYYNYSNATPVRCSYSNQAYVQLSYYPLPATKPAAFNGDNSPHNFENFGMF